MHAMVLGETDRIFSKPPLDARATAACLLEGRLPGAVIAGINSATTAPCFREIVPRPNEAPEFEIKGGGAQILPAEAVCPSHPFVNSSWSSATKLLPALGRFLLNTRSPTAVDPN